MIIPESDEAAEQIGSSQEGAVGGSGGSEHEVVSATGAGMPTVLLKLFGTQPAMSRVFVDAFGDLSQLRSVVSGLDIDFDDPRIRCDQESPAADC
ncbi:hypothetical protein E3A20_04970 [Planctomyces bekefii]|uniref:Uncharacterized protein n=1 Tax=Planctomyces bekefii TaxID=1653850 RepID=A0A5C6M993_9PLAN|nr:hypothetical protein E3A20_04970 [Planctomyces bekefii]